MIALAPSNRASQKKCLGVLMSVLSIQNWLQVIILSVQLAFSGVAGAESEPSSELFQQLDANADGLLDLSEVPAEHASLFRRLLRTSDSDADGKLSASEFFEGLTPSRPEKPLVDKESSEFPGSDALLLLLAWMDENSDLTIKAKEVPPSLRTVFDTIIRISKAKDTDQFRVRQLQQQAPQFAQLALRYTQRQQIDVELELALLSEQQHALVERLRGRVEPGRPFATRESAEAVFSRLDFDGDGVIALADLPEEVQERMSSMLTRADLDGDKRITEAEFLKFRDQISRMANQGSFNPQADQRTDQRIGLLLRRADTNGDGMLSRRESPRFLAARFPRADSNGDGQLDRQELSQILKLLNSSSAGPNQSSRPISPE